MDAPSSQPSHPAILPPTDQDMHNQSEDAASTSDNAQHVEFAPAQSAEPAGNSASQEPLDEAAQIQALTASVRDQDDMERSFNAQANTAIVQRENEKDRKLIDRIENEMLKKERERTVLSTERVRNPKRQQADMRILDDEIRSLLKDKEQTLQRMQSRAQDAAKVSEGAGISKSQRRPGETERDFLLRTGKITPFMKLKDAVRPADNLVDAMAAAANAQDDEDEDDDTEVERVDSSKELSSRHLAEPGFRKTARSAKATNEARASSGEPTSSPAGSSTRAKKPAVKKRKVTSERDIETEFAQDEESGAEYQQPADSPESGSSEYVESHDTFDPTPGKKRSRDQANVAARKQQKSTAAVVDDGNESVYQARLAQWASERRAARRLALGEPDPEDEDVDAANKVEYTMPCPSKEDGTLLGGIKVPGDVDQSLFGWQKVGVQWLWELYQQDVGGILADEMGLGKTVQAIAFLASLHHSKKLNKPVIIVCPTTIMKQWVSEFHRWWPALRVAILHSTGAGLSRGTAKKLVRRVVNEGHVLITTYEGVQSYSEELLPVQWGYAILDEGHKIRNPDTAVAGYCKELRTQHRIILSGTPIQNRLTELWSLFDFIYPMRLGTLQDFVIKIEDPIKKGGYAKASNLEKKTAGVCAQTLKDTISPYFLMRSKGDVAATLPKKSEQVLFCKLTPKQVSAYHNFLKSQTHERVAKGDMKALYSIDVLRKICNHPDLLHHDVPEKRNKAAYGKYHDSGKLLVVKGLLELWRKTGHKTLLFCQQRIMLDIVEKMLETIPEIKYCRMDGDTPVKQRQAMVNNFNKDDDLHVFLLSTKVGGLGTNLTGADRVIIYDPDWNPANDIQARERAWRLGQKRDVMIFRLMTAGTIEEKIYHYQLYKQFLSNKVLQDPEQQQSFWLKGIGDLFELGDQSHEAETETGSLFEGAEKRMRQTVGNVHGPANAPTPRAATESQDIAAISNVKRTEEMQTAAQGQEAGKDNLLEMLLGNSGVHSTFAHDQVMDSSIKKRKLEADEDMTMREAKRIAGEAAEQLRRSGEAARFERSQAFGSGSSSSNGGRAPAFGSHGGGTQSASSVLANLRGRQGGQPTPITTPRGRGANNSSSGGGGSSTHSSTATDFITQIQQFMQRQGGRVAAQMFVDHFNPIVGPSPVRVKLFQELVGRAAVLVGPSGAGRPAANNPRNIWVLRREFGGPADR